MASVNELIEAANFEKSPLIRLLEGAAGGVVNQQNQFYDNAVRLVQAQRIQQDMQMAQAKEQREAMQRQRESELEAQTKAAFNGVPGSPQPVFPKQKITKVKDHEGNVTTSTTYGDDGGSLGIPASVMSFVEKGDLEGLTQAYGGSVPIEVARLATANRAQTGVANRFETTTGMRVKEGKTRSTEKLRDDFTSQSKGFQNVTESYQRVIASAKDPSPAGDLALIFNYMKTLDPGSTVREGEFATAAQSGAFGDRIKAAAGRIANGERLSDEMRADFVNRAKLLYESQQSLQSQREQEFRRVGEGTGADVDKAIINFGAPKDSSPGQSSVKPGAVEDGYVFKGGDPADPKNWVKQ